MASKPPLSWNEIKSRSMAFSKEWADAHSEDGEAKPFWIAFFQIFGVSDRKVTTFEKAVERQGKPKGFVDLFWPGKLLVEHKSRGKNLDAAHRQANEYLVGLPESDMPRYLVLSDFARFRFIDLTTNQTTEFALEELHQHIHLFGFIAGYTVQQIEAQDAVNIRAAEQMGKLHDELKASGYDGHALESLLVRLLFCLFAEDTGIFPPPAAFQSFILERTSDDGCDLGPRLQQLFQTLNTPVEKRSKVLDEQVNRFPYVNGTLFAECLPIADFDPHMRQLLLDACALDWAAISPAIFGSLFQSIMDKDARRNLGAHYTSEENILKLIRPLFLDNLRAEFESVRRNQKKLWEFHQRLTRLRFFDPACGCGNFLVIAYRELRLLELDVLRAANKTGQRLIDVHTLIAVNVDQFYGIEIEEFPAQIAQVAMWLMDHLMNLKVGEEFGLYFARIPLTAAATIRHGNALRIDWNDVLPAQNCSYVLGNPPFVGAKYMNDRQREDISLALSSTQNAGLLDYVAAWYLRAASYIAANSSAEIAFVSTNSVVQGEQVGILWPPLLESGISISFAHRTFAWTSEGRGKAAVHCVIVGFSRVARKERVVFEYDDLKGPAHAVPVSNINPYLVDASNVVIVRRRRSLCNAPELGIGNKPIDGGNYLFTLEEMAAFLSKEPASKPLFRRWIGADEFLNGYERQCLWLGDVNPADLRKMPLVMARIDAVRRARLASPSPPTRKLAETPTRFHVENFPTTEYLVIPKVSSERRRFIPIGFEQPSTISSDLLMLAYPATLVHFGVLSSTQHNSWMRTVGGRLKSDYRYSKDIVYNNYPWPFLRSEHELDKKFRTAIEIAAQGVLDARAEHAGATLADLYDPIAMPPNLVKAHQKLDAAVDRAYESVGGPKSYRTEAERVAFLFGLYERYVKELEKSRTS